MNQDFYLNYGEAKSFYCAVDMGDLVYSLLFAKYKNVDTIYLDDTKKELAIEILMKRLENLSNHFYCPSLT